MGTNTSITSVGDKTPNGLNATINSFALTGNSSNFFLGAPFDATPNCGVATGLNKLTNNSTMIIYPNPTNSILNIEVKEQTQISIINVLGEVVKTETINGTSKLDVSDLNTGVYFIQDVKSGKAIKFIKE
jgi:hypothetical protein